MPFSKHPSCSDLISTLLATRFELGSFVIEWSSEQQLKVFHVSSPERSIWSTSRGHPFLFAAHGDAQFSESRGFFKVRDSSWEPTSSQSLDTAERRPDGIHFTGRLSSDVEIAAWCLRFYAIDDVQLGIDIQLEAVSGTPELNRICLLQESQPGEEFFGFGEQFTHLGMKGRRIPILCQEPGIGRGVQPLTWVMETLFGAGGDWHQSSAPAPFYLTTMLRAFCLENTEYCIFDLTEGSSAQIEVFSSALRGRIFHGTTPLGLIEAYTRFCGRMSALPRWMDSGAIIGMQGGSTAVRSMVAKLKENNASIAAMWLQDWVGGRKTSIGRQLWWNWEVDEGTYPDWNGLVDELGRCGIEVLSYINPFLIDASEKAEHRRNLYAEALERGFLVTKEGGEVYSIMNTSFSAALVDLSNPAAQIWMKEVIKSQLLSSGVSGWMADFGEALPFDADLAAGSAHSYHNLYPVEWARLNREAIAEAGRAGEVVFFTRAGFTQTPRYSTLFWMGDQLTAWDREDGMKSALTGLLSSGMSGISLNHGDIGGYTATTIPWLPFSPPFIGHCRTRELLLRWIELCAFTAVFRTHEGNQPDRNVQIDADSVVLQHFSRFSRLFAKLAPYRRELFGAAEMYGHPVVRHPWLHFSSDVNTEGLLHQFMLGEDFMIAPVMDPGQLEVEVYLPAGSWIHLWSRTCIGGEKGERYRVSAPIGAPAVFFRASLSFGEQLRQQLEAEGDIPSFIFQWSRLR
jgi:alpha-glucosidase (family GH31 glycosyl hydrolase)